MESVRVKGPATIANVSCGFDVLGFAASGIHDQIIARKTKNPGVHIKNIVSPHGELPSDPTRNTAAVSINAFLKVHPAPFGIEIEIQKGIPHGGGMGSSAASGAAGVFAANALLGDPCAPKDLIPFAMEGEKIACGAPHADNVAPALLGGFTAVCNYDPLTVYSIPYPESLGVALVFPHIEVRTEDARKVLKKEVSMRQVMQQTGNIAGFISGLCLNDFDRISQCLVDVIVEPLRAVLIPSFYKVKEAAQRAGALGCSISGSGPAIFALCQDEAIAQRASVAMAEVFTTQDIKSSHFSFPISPIGCQICE